jgi:anti-sigma regulatory factor (Ser/Thr protein kinase)
MEPLTVQGNLKSIEKLVNYVVTAASQAGLNRRATYCLRLAVDEIATNIITYGYQAAGIDGELEVTAVFQPNQLIIELKDSGQPFDPRQVPPPSNLKQPLQKRAVGNLGIFLAMWGVDGFQYEQTRSHNRNIFIMRHVAQKAHS